MKYVSIYRVQLIKTGTFPIESKMITSPDVAASACRQFITHEYGGYMPDREVLDVICVHPREVCELHAT